MNDEFYMGLALKEAWKFQGVTYPNPAVGALILDADSKIISIKAHEKAGSFHAELNAVLDAYKKITNDKSVDKYHDPNHIYEYLVGNHNYIFKDFTIYITLEPCNHQGKTPPCSFLLNVLGFKRVIIGSLDPNKIASGGCEYLISYGVDVKTGILKKECDNLIEPFVKWQQDSFIFFKMAHTLNGVYSGGVISSKESRTFVHDIRDKIDLLVIGGNTVRVDRPTLDCRLSGGEAPDVLIYSKEKDFDISIPLFKVKGRSVFIEDNFEKLKDYRYVMIEGGQGMFEATKEIVDWYLFFVSPDIKEGKKIESSLKMKKIHIAENCEDIALWCKGSDSNR